MSRSRLMTTQHMMDDLLEAEGTILLCDGALHVVDVTPCNAIAVFVNNVLGNNVRTPFRFKGLAISIANEYG